MSDNNIVNAFKRLERIGDEKSKTVEKIIEAVILVSQKIASDKKLFELLGNDYTIYGNHCVNKHGETIGNNLSWDTAFRFARDVFKSGLTEVFFNEYRQQK